MIRKTTILALFVSLFLTSSLLYSQRDLQQDNTVPGQLIIQLQPEANVLALIQQLPLPIPIGGITVTTLAKGWNIHKLQFDETELNATFLKRILEAYPAVAAVQYNHYLDRRTDPDDPDYGLQWGLNNSGVGGTVDADIDAPEAWDVTTGGLTVEGDTIVLAVIDEGFDLLHEDLSFWRNRAEIPGDGLDNDANGFIDDYLGWNAHDSTGTFPTDDHGTHVCGIAGAKGNNDIGISGVNWQLQILPIFIEIEEADAVAAYYYVYEMRKRYDVSNGTDGAFIVATNSSFGVDFAQPEDYPIWCSMYDSLGSYGILNAAATINATIDVDLFGDVPTACASEFLISVTNTDNEDELSGAGYGVTQIDLAAPGTNIYSTFPANTYGLLSGTSMSTPHVAGTVALLFAAACPKFIEDYKFSPASMSLLLKQYILEGVDPIADMTGRSVSEGRLNIFNAIQELENGYCKATGLSNPSLETEIVLMPNPASELVMVEIRSEETTTLKMQVVNMLGELHLAATELQLVQGINSFDLDLGQAPKGIYYLLFTAENGSSRSLKLVLQ